MEQTDRVTAKATTRMHREATAPPVRQLVQNSNRYKRQSSKMKLVLCSRLTVVCLRREFPFLASRIIRHPRRCVPSHCGSARQIVRWPTREAGMIWIPSLRIGDETLAHRRCERLGTLHVISSCPDHSGGQHQIIEEKRNIHGMRSAEAASCDRRWPINFIHPRAALGGAPLIVRPQSPGQPGTKYSGRRKKNVGR